MKSFQPAATPKIRPMTAVTTIATPPPTVTRSAARPIGAPPRCPPSAPSAARLAREHTAIAGMSQPDGTASSARIGNEGKGREARRGYPRGLHRLRKRRLVDAEFVAQVRAESVARAQLLGDSHRKLLVEAALHVDQSQFLQFRSRLIRELPRLSGDVGLLGVALRADGNIFTHGHRHRASDQASHAGDQDRARWRVGCRDADHEARGRDNRVI